MEGQKANRAIPRLQIGVMGGAFRYSAEAVKAAYRAGAAIARNGGTLVTGATTGVPFAAVLGAKSCNGLAVGISPAGNAREHVERYGKPLEGLDAIIYTGMGYNGREPINISSCDGIVYIGGEFGTLIEFGQGYYEVKVLGIITGVSGVSCKIKELVGMVSSSYGSEIIYCPLPEELVRRVIAAVEKRGGSAKHICRASAAIGMDVKSMIGGHGGTK
jgi:hypothetical protein